MKNATNIISNTLYVGIFLGLTFLISGGIFFAISPDQHLLTLQSFHHDAMNFSAVFHIFNYPHEFSPTEYIEIGILILIITQILRVLFTAWMFVTLKDYKFVGISLIILAVMLYSLCWPG